CPYRRPAGRTTASEFDQVRDPDDLLLVDAVADRDAGEARHRAGARVGQPHVIGRSGLAEDLVAHPIVAAAVPADRLRHRDVRPLAEALRDVDLVVVFDRPRLSFERLNVEPSLLAVERNPVAL